MTIRVLLICAGFMFVASCAVHPIHTTQREVAVKSDSITFAIIGDYGDDNSAESDVANMVKGWNPDFIITTGDNNYAMGATGTIKNNIGKYYCDYIYNPDAPEGLVCNGKASRDSTNRFFPSPGNHDNRSLSPLRPYVNYFTLPGDEKNYDFTWGPVHFYSINSGHGGKVGVNSGRAQWLKNTATQSKSPFNFVYFHHPPYSTSQHGSAKKMRWPYDKWGIDAVLCGHEHIYERVSPQNQQGPLYLICGNSGNDHLYPCYVHKLDTTVFNVFCDNTHFGATRVHVNGRTAIFEYFATTDLVNPIDVYYIRK